MSKTRKCIECHRRVTNWHEYGEDAVMCVPCVKERGENEEYWDDE
jgi:transcriptional regulator NrdR family protein